MSALNSTSHSIPPTHSFPHSLDRTPYVQSMQPFIELVAHSMTMTMNLEPGNRTAEIVYGLSSGSFRIPSTSNLLLASSRAQVCILYAMLASNSSLIISIDQSFHPHLHRSIPPSPSPPNQSIHAQPQFQTELSPAKNKRTHEVSGLKA